MSATLSDHSAPDYNNDALVNSSGVSNGTYTITYRAASAGQTLTIRFTDEKLYALFGNCLLYTSDAADE